ncbi:MAG TPA: tetratricopeptide repeat protein, partial [Kofleriaceae bacterium]|nr:tetratricopeptide repeat protein [Kofleriaceae bacterium]
HVLRELGRGSMGLVLRAYDPELARPVAIKLLRDVKRDELRDEARTLARLRHPNVVTVYDVFTDDHGVYLAMELVDGDTLRGYCKGRSQREVIAACVRAGRGLAAAHDAGVIHRDFKPENVLCGGDADVRVSDFGLAHTTDAAPDGTVAGTPAYMAPEILRREPATAASDQYSFCVTVHEMLTGTRPGEVDTSLPAWIQRVLRRGLARDPAGRYPSMHELLTALADDPKVRRRRRLLFGGVIGAALATGAVAVRLAQSSAPSCDIDDGALGDAWNAQRKQEVTRALGDRVARAIDIYAKSWVAVRHEACVATYDRGEQSRQALERRVACLDRGQHQLGELTKLFTTVDPTLLPNALEAVYSLRDPYTCTGAESYTVPNDPASHVVVEEARTLLDRARALQYGGKLDTADALAGQVVRLVEPLDISGLVAEAQLVQARVNIDRDNQGVAEDQLYKALHAAERAKDDRLVAETWIELVMTTGAQNHRFELAHSHAKAAEAAVARVNTPDLQVRLEYSLGALALAEAKLDDARTHLERAAALAGDDSRRLGQRGLIRSTLCDVERQAGKLPAAKERCKQALEILEEAFGEDHMRVALTLNVIGGIAFAERDWATAERTYKRVIETLERRKLTAQINYALALSNLGAVYSSKDDIKPAREYFTRALAVFEQHHPKHPQRLMPLQGLASLALRTGDTATAVERYTQVHDTMAASYAPEHPSLLVASYNLALAYVGNKMPDKAQAVLDDLIARATTKGKESWMLAERAYDLSAQIADECKDYRSALALLQKAFAAVEHANDPTERALVLRHQGEIARHMNKPALAIAPLEQAIKDFGKDPDAYDIGATRYHLAFALWDSGRDKKRAVEVAQQASDDLAKAQSGDALKQYRETLASFLALHKQ